MLISKRYITICLCVLIFASNGCKKQNQPSSSNTTTTISPMLYQKNDSIENALNFVETPEDKLGTYVTSIQNNGELASGDILKFANEYFNLGTNKNPELYISMLSEKTKEILDDDSKNDILFKKLNSIKEGTLINSENNKYLVVSSLVSKELQSTLRRANFTQMPTHRIIFYYFNQPKNMLIGSSVYFIEENSSYKIVLEMKSNDQLATEQIKPLPKTKTQNNNTESDTKTE